MYIVSQGEYGKVKLIRINKTVDYADLMNRGFYL